MGREETFVRKFPKCDVCLNEGVDRDARYEARTRHGAWGNMCEEHFKEFGVGLGVGMGQKLVQCAPINRDKFKACVREHTSKASRESIMEAVKQCAPATYRMTESDFEASVMDSVWYPKCPHCGSETGAEPDARSTCCDNCGQSFRIMNPFF